MRTSPSSSGGMGHGGYGYGQRVLGLMGREGQCAEHLGTIAESSGDDLDVVGCSGDGEAADRLAHRLEDQIPGRGHLPTDDDEVWVEVVAEVRDGAAGDAAGVGDRALAAGVTGERALEQLGHGDRA